ncbi:hypothetical protein C8R45DRAFT_1001308 [Mycena sanguinolenta]|nr:hypothetical protein C8R45DRAFT_1001308 [Mycena sanguinolenta]
MILTQDSDREPKAIGEQSDIIVSQTTMLDDLPPAYPHSPGPVNDPLAPMPLPDSVKPMNFLSLSRRNASIKGKYVIDPHIRVPQAMLPPLAEDESEVTRRNVFLHTSYGDVDADVFVVGDGDFKQRVSMVVKPTNGAVVLRVHASSTHRPPIHMKVHSSYGSVTLHVPRSFRGPVTIHTGHGSVRVSDALSADFTTFNEAKQTRRCFIGDYADWADQPGEWIGDEIEVESLNGSIKLQYDVELPSASTKGKGLLAKLFSWSGNE